MEFTKDSLRYDLLKEEFLLTQRQMDKYDQLSTTIKAWAVTAWVAVSGWAFQTKKKEIALLGILIVLIFWFFDGFNKVFRINYKNRRNEIQRGLQAIFQSETLPQDFLSPNLPVHDEKKVVRNMLPFHVGLPYIILIIVSLIIYIRL